MNFLVIFYKKFTPFKQWHKKIHGILEIFAKILKNLQKFTDFYAFWQLKAKNSLLKPLDNLAQLKVRTEP